MEQKQIGESVSVLSAAGNGIGQGISNGAGLAGNSSAGKTSPEKRFSAGAISATVWKNNGTSKLGQPVEYRTVSLQRSYKKDGKWQNANSMRVSDLPKAALLLNKAFEWLVLKSRDGASGGGSGANGQDGEEDVEF